MRIRTESIKQLGCTHLFARYRLEHEKKKALSLPPFSISGGIYEHDGNITNLRERPLPVVWQGSMQGVPQAFGAGGPELGRLAG